MKLNDYFLLEELVSQETYKKYGDSSIWFIDPNMIDGLLAVRNLCGPLVVNNRYKGGPFNYRGYRPPDYKDGATESQHRFGRAVDISSLSLSNDDLRKKILDNWAIIGHYFTTMELDTDTWVHLDCRHILGYDKSKGPFFVHNPKINASVKT